MQQLNKQKHVNKGMTIRFVLALSLLMLSACTAQTNRNNANPDNFNTKAVTEEKGASSITASPDSDFPLSFELDGKTIAIEAKPNRIIALSLDTADAVLELTDSSAVAAITKSIENPYLAFNETKGNQIADKVGSVSSLDPEKILSYNPDLILLTTQHGSEVDADKILSQAGIPLISLKPWSSLEQIKSNVLIIGKALGEEKRAAEVVADLTEKVNKIQEVVDKTEIKPSLLVISPVGTNTGPYLLGQDSLTSEIVRLSGAIPTVEMMGLKQTTKASVEQIIKSDPDYILLSDWEGKGEAVFTELMNAPGWNTLKAVKDKRIKVMPAKYLVAANIHAAEGIEEIAKWLHPELF